MASQQVDSSTHPENHNVESELAPPIRVRYVAEINSTGVWIDSPSPTPLRKRKLPIWLNPVQGDLKKCKAEPDAEQKHQVGSSNPGPNTSQNCDIPIKKEIKEEPQDGPSNGIILQPCIPTVKTETVVKEEATSSIRDSCEFGIRCYKRNSTHRSNMAHPGDIDYRRPTYPDPSLGTPACPFGSCCYRRNPVHFQQFAHPPSSIYTITMPHNTTILTLTTGNSSDQKQMMLRKRAVKKEDYHQIDDDFEEDDDDDLMDFSVDGDSDDYIPSDTDYNDTEEF